MKPVQIAGRSVGPGAPVFIVAEIGINHNGDTDLAKRTIDAAVRAGATSVKFQSYRTEDFIPDRTLTYEYVSAGRTVVESQYEMFKRCELTQQHVAELKQYCDRAGTVFHSTPTNERGVADLVALGVPVLKNGSDYLTHLELIRSMGASGLPTVLSTGMATLEEVDDAVRAFRETGNEALILLHCTSRYPTPSDDIHLPRMRRLSQRFGALVGFSDHTEGYLAAVAATALGACWIEKHFTLDKTLPGPDHPFSSDEAEFAQLVQAVRATETAMIDSDLDFSVQERENRENFRLSCQTREPLAAGHVLRREDIVFQRPGTGLPPKLVGELLGRGVVRDLPAHHVLRREDLIL